MMEVADAEDLDGTCRRGAITCGSLIVDPSDAPRILRQGGSAGQVDIHSTLTQRSYELRGIGCE